MEITEKTAQQLRLTVEEFQLIKEKLGRTPNFNELCAFSAMWSEHCSYKNSIKWLKTLPREGGKMLVKAGEENAGLMDIGDGLGVVFKIESHNHPSAIEPFQGAATGVGGIHRDIFTMGARPIAALNSLRFGNLTEEKTQHLLAGVVHGIGHYGNCFGVPTVGGEIYFENCYHTNPLVNAMSVGIVKLGETVSATATGAGNPVMYVGSATGKDGIGGASFASADITEESTEELPAVQVGDPFQEKIVRSLSGNYCNRRCSCNAGHGSSRNHLFNCGNECKRRGRNEDRPGQSAHKGSSLHFRGWGHEGMGTVVERKPGKNVAGSEKG
jgi:phosphoribosylformylglycinamidine synthase